MVASSDAVTNSLPAVSSALCRAAPLPYARRMSHAPEDSALMLRYKDGDTAAFEVLYRRHNDALYRYLLRLCKNRHSAEDVFQDVWGKIIKARGTYRPTAKFTTFMYRVAHNCFIDHVRRNKRHGNNTEFEPEIHASGGEHLETTTERSLARQRLSVALGHLPDEQRDVFLLFEESGLSLEEIATVTGSNRETVKSRLRYAVKKLRSAIQEPE